MNILTVTLYQDRICRTSGFWILHRGVNCVVPLVENAEGAFSTLLRQSGLRASTGGVLATKSERKMLASTCLYSVSAWLLFYISLSMLEMKLKRYSLIYLLSLFVK